MTLSVRAIRANAKGLLREQEAAAVYKLPNVDGLVQIEANGFKHTRQAHLVLNRQRRLSQIRYRVRNTETGDGLGRQYEARHVPERSTSEMRLLGEASWRRTRRA